MSAPSELRQRGVAKDGVAARGGSVTKEAGEKPASGRMMAYLLLGLLQVSTRGLDITSISVPAQCLLMPFLALVPLAASPSRTRSWMFPALFFSWMGDMLPQLIPKHLGLPVLIGSFAVAQVCWVTCFFPRRNRTGLYVALAWLGPVIGLVLLCLPGAGALAPAVIVYATLLLSMATAAASWGKFGVLGGSIFLVSDALIALGVFAGVDFVGREVAVMATYIPAQALLVTAAMAGAKKRQ